MGAGGVFERLQELLLDELGRRAGLVARDRGLLQPAGGSGDLIGANPVDRAKRGSKLHLANEGGGMPLALLMTAANTPDAAVFEALLGDLPKVRTPAGGRALPAGQGSRRQGLR
jgi:hypothetical protein